MIKDLLSVEKIYNPFTLTDVKEYEYSGLDYQVGFKITKKRNDIIAFYVYRKYKGTIAYHEGMYIANNYLRQGYGKNIHNKELAAYRECGITRIELKAVHDGTCVWLRMGFQINYDSPVYDDHEKRLLQAYQNYLGQYHFPDDPDTVEILMESCKSAKSIVSKEMMKYTKPDESTGIMRFTDFARDIISGTPMWKEVRNIPNKDTRR